MTAHEIAQGTTVRPDELHTSRHGSPVHGALTHRQVEVLREIAIHGHFGNAAACLGLSEQTVKNHATNAYDRLDVHGMLDAFTKLGWLRVP